jgi:hypothetical protein
MKNPKILLVVACLALACTPAFAGSYVFVTPAGSTDAAAEPVSAQATFTTGAGTLSIFLENLIVNQKSAGQLLSDLFFTINGITTGGSLDSSSGTERNVAADGTFADGSTVSTGWAFHVTAGVFHLDGLNDAVNVPEHEIIGAPDGTGVYSNANSSIAGNDPHNPFLKSGVTFNLTFAGMTADTVISGATFSFGTASGDNVPGIPKVPDSGMTLILLGVALATVEGSRRLLARRARI